MAGIFTALLADVLSDLAAQGRSSDVDLLWRYHCRETTPAESLRLQEQLAFDPDAVQLLLDLATFPDIRDSDCEASRIGQDGSLVDRCEEFWRDA